jgi:hypothetical protein
VAKRKRKPRRPREPVPAESYRDHEGNVLILRSELSSKTIEKIGEGLAPGASADDVWRRREEMLFERLAVSWEIAGLEPLTDQAMLLGRYRMADSETQRWVRETVTAHIERHIPGLAGS